MTRYCWRCAAPLPAPPPVTCASCGEVHYANPKPCGNAVAIDSGRVLMLLRARDPDAGTWTLPGGFCEGDEHPMHAAERELREETGLRGQASAYLGTWMDSYGVQADGSEIHTAVSGYLVELDDPAAAPTPEPGEALEVRWFDLDDLPAPLAFPAHIPPMLAVGITLARGGARQPLYDRTW